MMESLATTNKMAELVVAQVVELASLYPVGHLHE
jgi:hypothetical protein